MSAQLSSSRMSSSRMSSSQLSGQLSAQMPTQILSQMNTEPLHSPQRRPLPHHHHRLHFGDVVLCPPQFPFTKQPYGMIVEAATPTTPRTSSFSYARQPNAYVVLIRHQLYTFPASVLRWKYKIPYPHAKIRFLFCTEPPAVRCQIHYDHVSLYSVTDQPTAQKIALFCKSLPGMSSSSVITDGTACIGGNTIAFARTFAHVHAIEWDTSRCTMLRHNVQLLLDRTSAQHVNVHNEDYTATYDRYTQDLVFLDPPWGGKAYKHQSTVDLYLGDLSLSVLCQRLLDQCAHVVIKVPTNFNVKGLSRGIRRSVRVVRIAGKVMLVVVSGG